MAAKHSRAPQLRASLAVAYYNLGYNHRRVGKFDEAVVWLEKARVEQVKLMQENPAVTLYQFLLGRSCNELGYTHSLAKRPQEATPFLTEAVRLLEPLVRDYPTVMDYGRDLALTYRELGKVATTRTEQLRQYDRAIELSEKLVQANPTVPVLQMDLATAYRELGLLEADRPKRLVWFGKAIEVGEKLVKANPGNLSYEYELAMSHSRTAFNGYQTAGDYPAALKHYEKGLALLEDIVARAPNGIESTPILQNFCWGMTNACGLLSEKRWKDGLLSEAAESYARGAQVCRTLVDRFPGQKKYWRALTILNVDRGRLLLEAEKNKEAEAAFKAAVDGLDRSVRKGHYLVKDFINDQGFAPLRSRDDYRKLLAEFAKDQP
jgi:tetratricopeptide (TPR) repeat protein